MLAIGLALLPATQALADADLKVASGLTVSFEYTLTLKDKSVADINVGGESLSYIQGQQQILPNLEKGLEGMQVGQTKTILLNAADAYGLYNDKAVVSVDKKKIPPKAKAGSILMPSEGQSARILELTEDKAMINFNHPLAGQDLTFDVKILGVERSEKPIS